MITRFTFTVGLPGCGKSTYIKEHFKKIVTFHDYMIGHDSFDEEMFGNYLKDIDNDCTVVISADDIKYYLPGYSSDHPELVHEKSVQYAKNYILELSKRNDFNFIDVVLDGGGVNGHYNNSIIASLKEIDPLCIIKCVYFDTPVNVCLERINKRERKVPVEEIFIKNQKLPACVNNYKHAVDSFERVDYFTNKYLFLDMDGTIASYTKVKKDMQGDKDFVNGETFVHLKPVSYVIDFVRKNYKPENIFILTACPNSICWTEKLEWLNVHFPEIISENIFFVGNKDYKHVFLKHLAIKKKMKLKDICLVDDYHYTIDKCIEMGCNVVHPSNIYSLKDNAALFG